MLSGGRGGFCPALATILLPNSVAPNEIGRDEQVPPFLFCLMFSTALAPIATKGYHNQRITKPLSYTGICCAFRVPLAQTFGRMAGIVTEPLQVRAPETRKEGTTTRKPRSHLPGFCPGLMPAMPLAGKR